MWDDSLRDAKAGHFKTAVVTAVLVGLTIVSIMLLVKHLQNGDVGKDNRDIVTSVVRKASNRLEVQVINGAATTAREASGGPFGIFEGRLTIRQPFSVSYHVDMSKMNLSDYSWNERAKTLFVRLPEISPDAPNIDQSRQIIAAKGWVITQEMQNIIRRKIAIGAVAQANSEALKPEHLKAARENARSALARNLEGPLEVAGVKGVHVEVIDSLAGERWDVSRSLAQVLASEAK